MKHIELNLLARYGLFFALVLLLRFLLTQIYTGEWNHMLRDWTVAFIIYSLIGASFHLLTTNVFNKSIWKVNVNVTRVVFTVLFLLFAIAHIMVYAPLGGFTAFESVLRYAWLMPSVHSESLLIVFQVVFGYSLLSLFLTSKHHPSSA